MISKKVIVCFFKLMNLVRGNNDNLGCMWVEYCEFYYCGLFMLK